MVVLIRIAVTLNTEKSPKNEPVVRLGFDNSI